MPTFDYIASKDFRESLEADHAEMQKCMEAQAWKSAQVLAGSIIEALLIDYLVSAPNPSRAIKDPLKTDLGAAISICQSEGVISERIANLCSVIKSFRNLIHPGRVIRLSEKAPDKSSASVATALVEMITQEIADFRRTAAGLTADQLLSKIERDEHSLTILPHLLQEVSLQQRTRLLIELIPVAHADATREDDMFGMSATRLEKAYRTILEAAPDELRSQVAQEFVRILREEDGSNVIRYGEAFFQAKDIKFLLEHQKAMVREHLLGRVGSLHKFSTLKVVKGIVPSLGVNDVDTWIDPFVRTLVSNTVKAEIKQRAREQLIEDLLLVDEAVGTQINKRLERWIKHFDNEGSPQKAEILRELTKEIADWSIPF